MIVWNRVSKRDRWGKRANVRRSADAWIDVPAPQLRIVDEALWQAAHRRLDAAAQKYLKGTNGRPFGRPPSGDPAKYLLTHGALRLLRRPDARSIPKSRQWPQVLLRLQRLS